VRVAQEQGYQAPIDVDARLAAMSYGGAGDSGVHATHLSVTAALLNQGMSVDDVVEKVLGATQKKSGTGNWDWREEAKTIRGMCETWIKDPRYTPKDTASKESAEQPDGADAENVIDMGAARAKRKPKDPPPKDAKKKQMHIVLGKAVLEALRERGERIMTTNEGAYWYAGGSWSIVDDKDLKRQLNNEIEIGIQALDWVSNTKLRNETREWILVQPEVCRRNIKFDQHDAQVPVANGMLYPLTGMLEIAQPEHYVTWRVPYDYDAKAPCKVWLQMLDEILGDREPAVRKQYVAMLQRVLGIGLVNMIDKNLTRALVFIGPSNAGKSQLLEVITALYGGEVIALPLSALENPHGTSAFIRRLAWVVHEVFTEGKLHLSDVVKSIISREIIGLNIKNGPHVNRRYLGPIAWATNHPPTFREATKAITNRLILVHCRQVFVQNNPIGTAGIAAKDKCASPAHYVIKHEMPGVLAWAVEGLKKVLADRRLEIPLEAQAAAEEIQRDSNVAIGFFAECIECEPNGVVSQPDVYAAFASYWDETYGTDRVPSPKRLVQSVALMGDKRVAINDAEARMRKSGARYYGCIKLNPDGLKHWKNTITSDKWRAGKTTNVSAEGENPNQVMPPAWVDYTPVTLARSEQEKHPTKSFFYNSDGDDDGAMTDDGDEKGPMTERASPKTQSSARHPRQRPDPKGRTRF
jgi:phage/plasmid-associated DNA primase